MNIQKHFDRLCAEIEMLEMSCERSMFVEQPKKQNILEETTHICNVCGEKNTTYSSPNQTLYSKTTDSYFFTCKCGHIETIYVWDGVRR